MKKVYLLTEEQIKELKDIQVKILSQVDLGLKHIKSNSGNLFCIQELAEQIGCILNEE